ncbi:MAG: glycoside hydrolase family 30 beta sandwich domain-containing protein [Lachnospiraceae bacterium]|nr:glycoside hydrolase family 30 beta sandwich domain-containing protein [Lachnospiraceae bacterium]
MTKLEYVVTTFPNREKQTEQKVLSFVKEDEIENEVINIYPEVTYQRFNGFGGAVTETAGYMYSLMDAEQKKEMLETYYGKDTMKYRMVRMPLDSCDFSLEHFQASVEPDLSDFSFQRVGKYTFPLLRDIQAMVGEDLELMLTPWSPPAYMKTNGDRNHGGKLKAEYRKTWAEYICHYIMELKKEGFTVTCMSIQNEPKAVQTWDSCIFTAQEEKVFLEECLYPAMEEHALTQIRIYIWDHNKERAYERARDTIDEKTDKIIKGIALHWYSGDHFDALQMIREKYPDKELVLSEACIEYSKCSPEDFLKNAQKYAHDLIGNLNHGLTGFYDWNLAVDEVGGPNHVGNFCDAPYLFDTKSKVLMERNSLVYLWHFSHYITPGAVRVGTTCYTDKLETTAFHTEAGCVIVILNRTEEDLPVVLRLHGESVTFSVPGGAICSGRIL